MNKVLLICVAAWIVILTPVDVSITWNPSHDSEENDYSDTGAEVISHDENICASVEGRFDYAIRVAYFHNDESNKTLAGQWDGDQQLILLSMTQGLDMDTVVHEVGHAVEDMLVLYELEDPHFRQYFQGRWSECIWQIVSQDLEESKQIEAELPKFRFAN